MQNTFCSLQPLLPDLSVNLTGIQKKPEAFDGRESLLLRTQLWASMSPFLGHYNFITTALYRGLGTEELRLPVSY